MLESGTEVRLYPKEPLTGGVTLPTTVTFLQIITIGKVEFIEAATVRDEKMTIFWQRLDSVGVIEEAV